MENVITKREVRQYFGSAEKGVDFSVEIPDCATDSKKLFAKRALDVAVSLFAIVFILSWLYPLLAILIKVTSKGPVLFMQLRHGLNNEPFYCYKFRTMVANKDADVKQATKGDSRITPIGRFLRASSIDELPQLFNVLRGDMAIVGPRPHAIPMNLEFAKNIDNFMYRHQVKPGITGLAQIKGYRGEIRDFHDIYGRFRFDLFYVKNWCLLFDIKIILNTFTALVFKSDNAY
jgi:putative colanic acid biosynthesis UDP-glucose lipid carrier transferase